MPFQVRQLQAFKSVIELGSATRAARALGISQPAVSKLLGGLSDLCCFELFVRTGNRLDPTAEALMLFREVERLFVSVDHIERQAEAIRENKAGQISLAAFPALATRALPKLLRQFTEGRSETRLSLIARSGRLLVELVASDRVDIGIGLMTLEHPAVSVESLGTMEAVCVMSPHDPLARKSVIEAADLEGKPFISLGAEDQSRYRIDAAFEGTKIHRNIVIEAHQSEAACSFASLGAGVAIVEPFSASGFRADELAVRAFRPTVLFELWAMTPINRQRSIISTDFLQFFREQLNTFQFTSTQARKAKRTKSR